VNKNISFVVSMFYHGKNTTLTNWRKHHGVYNKHNVFVIPTEEAYLNLNMDIHVAALAGRFQTLTRDSDRILCSLYSSL